MQRPAHEITAAWADEEPCCERDGHKVLVALVEEQKETNRVLCLIVRRIEQLERKVDKVCAIADKMQWDSPMPDRRPSWNNDGVRLPFPRRPTLYRSAHQSDHVVCVSGALRQRRQAICA